MTALRQDPSSRGCPEHELAHLYVAGTLPEPQRDAFEIHLLTCARCRDAVREGAGIRAALRASPHSAGAPRSHWPFRSARAAWAVVASAAAVVLIVVARREDPVRGLGRVREAPRFVALSVRPVTTAADAVVDSAMAAYAAGDYADADRLLSSATARPGPATSFFIGVARLMRGQAEQAIAPLRAAREPAGNAYAAEAEYYLAKAWLRLGTVDSAVVHLRAVPVASAVASRAATLLDSVQRMSRQ